jgi:hypothetical protein
MYAELITFVGPTPFYKQGSLKEHIRPNRVREAHVISAASGFRLRHGGNPPTDKREIADGSP